MRLKSDIPNHKGFGDEWKHDSSWILEVAAKLLEATGYRHSGQAKRDPESRILKQFGIPAPAPDSIRGSQTDEVTFAGASILNQKNIFITCRLG